MRWVWLLLLAACEEEPEPKGKKRTCDFVDPGSGMMVCRQAELCCEQVTPQREECEYVSSDGRRFPCASPYDCDEAKHDLVCHACPDASTGGPYDTCP